MANNEIGPVGCARGLGWCLPPCTTTQHAHWRWPTRGGGIRRHGAATDWTVHDAAGRGAWRSPGSCTCRRPPRASSTSSGGRCCCSLRWPRRVSCRGCCAGRLVPALLRVDDHRDELRQGRPRPVRVPGRACRAPHRGPGRHGDRRPSEAAGWSLRVIQITVVCTYCLAAWAKIRFGGWGWMTGLVLARVPAPRLGVRRPDRRDPARAGRGPDRHRRHRGAERAGLPDPGPAALRGHRLLLLLPPDVVRHHRAAGRVTC